MSLTTVLTPADRADALARLALGGQVTDRDIDLADAVSSAAARAKVTAVPILCRTIEIAIDTIDPAVIAPAWASAVVYVARPDGELADPHRRGPGVWFQRTDFPDPSRIHIDVQVEYSSAHDVLAQAVTAGAVVRVRAAPVRRIVA